MKLACSLGWFLLSTVLCLAEVQVGIHGLVNKPGIHSMSEAQGLLDLLHAAGGLEPNANSKSIRIVTQDRSSTKKTVFEIDVHSALADKIDYELPPGANVFVSSGFLEGLHGEELKQFNASIDQFVARDDKKLKKLKGIDYANTANAFRKTPVD